MVTKKDLEDLEKKLKFNTSEKISDLKTFVCLLCFVLLVVCAIMQVIDHRDLSQKIDVMNNTFTNQLANKADRVCHEELKEANISKMDSEFENITRNIKIIETKDGRVLLKKDTDKMHDFFGKYPYIMTCENGYCQKKYYERVKVCEIK